MKKALLWIPFLVLLSTPLLAANRFWIAGASSNWNNPLNWSTTSGGAGGASVPGSGDVAIFNASGPGNCVLDIAPTVGGITMSGYTGSIDLSGFSLTTTGTNTFSSGIISNSGASASLIINGTATTTFSGTTFQVEVTGSGGRINFNGSVFQAAVSLTKVSTGNDNGQGGNTFQAGVTLTNSTTSDWQLGGANPDVFNATLSLVLNSTGDISLARVAAGNQFNGDISITYNSTGDVLFGATNGTSTLSVGRTVTIAGYGVSGCGDLTLANFTQSGATAQSITLAGNNAAKLTLGPSSLFNGAMDITAPDLDLNTSTFQSTLQLTKTGNGQSNLHGGNIFNGNVTVTNNGFDLMFGHYAGDAGDQFNADATFNNLGGNRIRIAEETAGTIFQGTVILNSAAATDNNNRIQVSRLAGAECTFNGPVYINNTGNAADIHISFDAGTMTTFNGPVYVLSSATNASEFYFGNDGNVAFNGDIEFNSTNSDDIYLAAGTGVVTFGNGTMSIGATGFAAGSIRFVNFTQTGAATQSLTVTGTASLRFGPSSTFNGAVNFIAPQIYLNGCTFNGITYIEKTGATQNTGSGSNVFNGVTTIVNSGSGSFLSGNTSNDTFNNDLTLTNSGSAYISMAHNSAGNVFGGNITLNCTAGQGIYFANNTGASASLANGRTISVGSSGFTVGELRLRRFTQTGGTAQILTLTGTALLELGPSSSFGGDVTFTAPSVDLDGTTFQGVTSIQKTGSVDDVSTGGNIYNGVTTLINNGGGSWDLANTSPDIYNAALTVTNSGTNRIQLGISSAGNQFNGDVTLNHNGPVTTTNNFIVARNAGSSATFGGSLTLNCNSNNASSGIIIALDGSVVLNGNVHVTTTSGRGILFGSTSGTVTLSNGRTITAGAFAQGTLLLRGFTQVGNTPQSITLTGSASLTLGSASAFGGNVAFIAPQITLNGVTFDGTAYLEKTGATDNTGAGSNIFNGVTTLVNSGSGAFISGNTSSETFNSDVTLTNTGTSYISVAAGAAGSTFNGNIAVNCTGGTGVFIGNNTGATVTLASGRTISVGASGFSTGQLRIRRFTQTGTTAQALTLTGNSALYLGPSSSFDGSVTFAAPQVFLNGTIFNGTTYIEKTGAADNQGTGSNTFNGVATLVNSGTGGLISGNTSVDTFNNDLTLNNTGTSYISIADNSSGNVINGNITVSCTSGSGIYFGNNGGATVTLASGRSITVGPSGFSAGQLRLKRFTQPGSTTQNLTLTGTAAVLVGPSSSFGGDVSFVAPQIFLNGATFNGTAYIEKNGATNNTSTGSNVFNGVTTLVNSGSGTFVSGNASSDVFNADLTLTNTGSAHIAMADNTSGNVFQGNIIVNSTAGNGVYFGDGGAAASCTLAAGRTITVGASGFSAGQLRLRRFTQTGSTAQSLTLTGTAIIRVGPSSEFNGDVTFVAPRILLDGATFNGSATIQKNGASNDTSNGGNTFNGVTTITSSGSGIFRLASTTGDNFAADVTFVRNGSGVLDVAYTQTNSFGGSLTVNSTSGVTFGGGGGTVQFNGAGAQSLNKAVGSASPVIPILVMNKPSGTLTANTNFSVSNTATFTSGVIETTSTNFLNFADNTTVSGASNLSYVDGPVRKTGNDAFTFPVGDGGFYQGIGISAPALNTDHFTAQYFRAAQPFGGTSSWSASFYTISGCEYWQLDRTNGSSNVFVTISWDAASCGYTIGNLSDLAIAHYRSSLSTWVNEGNGGTTGTTATGTITSAAPFTSFSPITLGSIHENTPLPVELGSFWYVDLKNAVQLEWETYTETDNEGFTIQRAGESFEFTDIGEVAGAGNSTSLKKYQFTDYEPFIGVSYYRLKQRDFDGTISYSKVLSVERDGRFSVHPNPASDERVFLNQRGTIVILNTLNQPVMTVRDAESFDASGLAAGVYLIRNERGQYVRWIKE
jgi:hypothetical protein